MQDNNGNLIEVRGLKKYFPAGGGLLGAGGDTVKAVDDVSFSIRHGETFGLVGESGCGKSTTGRCILRLIEPTAGEVNFEGQDLLALDARSLRQLRREMQIIFQDPYASLNPRMQVGEIIAEPLVIHRAGKSAERRRRVGELLELVGLKAEHAARYPHEFSGGQRQRICIARALSLNPKFIICDESVSALDVSVQAQVLNLLIKLREEFKFTYIFISHDLSVVKFMSDRMVVMNRGKIEEMGISDDIYNNPQKEYTQKLIAAIPKGELNDIRKRLEAEKARLN